MPEAGDVQRQGSLMVELTTAHVADACARLGVAIRACPREVRPVVSGTRLCGRARPVQHFGSADIFFEVLNSAQAGEVLVIDNGGRVDEACVGDLVTLEVKHAGLAGIVIWGSHRDTAEIVSIDFPVFSVGANPVGPRRSDERAADAKVSALVGEAVVTADDFVIADDDGVLFIPSAEMARVTSTAELIQEAEAAQATAVRAGVTLRDQLQINSYSTRRQSDPEYTFRRHLKEIGGAIEE